MFQWAVVAAEVMVIPRSCSCSILYMEWCARIVSYKLHSQYFPHVTKDHKIPAFVGSVVLKCHGPQPMIGLVRMLLKFGEYAGIGIKTSMGMGGVRCT